MCLYVSGYYLYRTGILFSDGGLCPARGFTRREIGHSIAGEADAGVCFP